MMRLLHLLNRDSREFTNVAQAASENEVGVFGEDSDEGEAEERDMTTGAFHFTTEISAEAISDNCTSPLDNIHFEEPHVIGTLVPLGLVCLVVILGNMMVIFAVFNTHKLRGATYLFIVSLACADLVSPKSRSGVKLNRSGSQQLISHPYQIERKERSSKNFEKNRFENFAITRKVFSPSFVSPIRNFCMKTEKPSILLL